MNTIEGDLIKSDYVAKFIREIDNIIERHNARLSFFDINIIASLDDEITVYTTFSKYYEEGDTESRLQKISQISYLVKNMNKIIEKGDYKDEDLFRINNKSLFLKGHKELLEGWDKLTKNEYIKEQEERNVKIKKRNKLFTIEDTQWKVEKEFNGLPVKKIKITPNEEVEVDKPIGPEEIHEILLKYNSEVDESKKVNFYYASEGDYRLKGSGTRSSVKKDCIVYSLILGCIKKNKKDQSLGTIINFQKDNNGLIPAIQSFMTYYFSTVYYKNQDKLIEVATKSAISQIMARNMSHNMGSHVYAALNTFEKLMELNKKERIQYSSVVKPTLNYESDISKYWKEYQKISKIKAFDLDITSMLEAFALIYLREIDNREYKTVFSDELENKKSSEAMSIFNKHRRFFKEQFQKRINKVSSYSDQLWTKANERKKEIGLLYNLASLNSYIKSRMDFLSDIATSEKSHNENDNWLIKDILNELDDNRIVLNNISGIDNVSYDIVWNIEESIKVNEDVLVAMPNNILGHQALFIIIENIIRNTCKYQSPSEPFSICIDIKDSEEFPEYYEVLIHDNILIDHEKKDSDIFNKYLDLAKSLADNHNKFRTNKLTDEDIVEKYSSLSPLQELLILQNYRLNKNILNNNEELRDDAYGCIELDVCASYLRKEKVVECDNEYFDVDTESMISELTSDSTFIQEGEKYNQKYYEYYAKSHEIEKKPYLVKAVPIKDSTIMASNVSEFNANEKAYYFGYRFFLLKPKRLLILTEDKITDKGKLRKLLNLGCKIVTLNSDDDIDKLKKQDLSYKAVLIIQSRFLNRVKVESTLDNELSQRRLYLKTDRNNEDYKNYFEVINSVITKIFEKDQTTNLSDQLNELITRIWQESFDALLSDRKKSTIILSEKDKNQLSDPSVLKLKYVIKKKDDTNKKEKVDNDPRKLFFAKFDDHSKDSKMYLSENNEFTDIKLSDFYSHYNHVVKNTLKSLVKNSKAIFDESRYTNNEWVMFNLLESCVTRFLVIDERIQKASTNKKYQGKDGIVMWSDLLRAHGIETIPTRIINFNEANFLDKYHLLAQETSEFINKYSNFDFIVIHIGIIEKYLDSLKQPANKKNVEAFLVALANNTSINEQYFNKHGRLKLDDKKNVNRFIITSGRGRPKTISEQLKFIHFSSLSNALITKFDKFTFSNLILNCRI